MISNMEDTCLEKSRSSQRFVGFFLNCAFGMLIGWADKFGSRDMGIHVGIHTFEHKFVRFELAPL